MQTENIRDPSNIGLYAFSAPISMTPINSTPPTENAINHAATLILASANNRPEPPILQATVIEIREDAEENRASMEITTTSPFFINKTAIKKAATVALVTGGLALSAYFTLNAAVKQEQSPSFFSGFTNWNNEAALLGIAGGLTVSAFAQPLFALTEGSPFNAASYLLKTTAKVTYFAACGMFFGGSDIGKILIPLSLGYYTCRQRSEN